ncbi:hypothetical protein TTHT_1136 [Thermotomaculum hydrothermale]|uniref:PKD domain-containing protein n=1 Tax=Thermotomaculum hydrothermale TaxID=981385 RepID=A0A7R6SZB6_9BACT|nr:hypothetical protein [Thermotomaculum hydrothermale]BBB32670.1 hypothetical protein TTHT_1136 [Thermotomaculum hydrothermale]
MTVKFTVDAYDPEGDALFYTFHIFNENGEQYDIISESNIFYYTFYADGNYTVKVSVSGSHNETTLSKALSVKVLPSNTPIKISVLTSRQLAGILNEDFGKVSAKTVFYNDKDYNVTINIKGYNNGEPVIDKNETILPNQTFVITEHYLVVPTTDVIVYSSAHIKVSASIFTPEGIARAWYKYDNTIQMYVPYIEENTGFRDSYVYISNPYVKPVAYTFNETINELPEDYTIILNAGSYVSPLMDSSKCWGLVRDEIIQTFNNLVEEKTLNGLGISVDFDKKPAMYELKQDGSTRLYLPFIPHIDCYNDLVLLNTGDRESDVVIRFFDNHGIKTGEYTVNIPDQQRVKIYLEKVLYDLDINADYAVIDSIQPIIGVNEVKLLYGGEYAFTLPSYGEIGGYSSVVLSDDYYWTAFSLVNTTDQEISITFALYTASGNFKVNKFITVPKRGMLASYIKDIFNDVEIQNGDSVVIISTKPISGLTLQGNYSLTRVSALPIF